MDMMENDRMVLRSWREEDAEALYRYASDARVSEMALWPRHTSLEMSRMVIREFFMPNPHTLAIELKSTGEAVGCIGLVPQGDEHYTLLPGEREVGYWIGFPYWGKGLTSEALLLLMDFCRYSLGLESLLVTADIRNVASQRVAEKCGFEKIGRYSCDGIDGYAYRRRMKQ